MLTSVRRFISSVQRAVPNSKKKSFLQNGIILHREYFVFYYFEVLAALLCSEILGMHTIEKIIFVYPFTMPGIQLYGVVFPEGGMEASKIGKKRNLCKH